MAFPAPGERARSGAPAPPSVLPLVLARGPIELAPACRRLDRGPTCGEVATISSTSPFLPGHDPADQHPRRSRGQNPDRDRERHRSSCQFEDHMRVGDHQERQYGPPKRV